MQITRITTPNIYFSAKKKSQPKDNSYLRTSIFGQEEIKNLYIFAKEHKNDNIALKIFPTPLADCKYVMTQKDLNNNTGEWLDITDYDPDVY